MKNVQECGIDPPPAGVLGLFNMQVIDALIERVSATAFKEVATEVLSSSRVPLLVPRAEYLANLATTALARNEPWRSITPSKYLLDIPHRPHREALMRWVTAEHGLMVETGRWKSVVRELRMCRLCGLEVEDELHVMFVCTADRDLVRIRAGWLESLGNRDNSLRPPHRVLSHGEMIQYVSLWLRTTAILPLLAKTVYGMLAIMDSYEEALLD